jgi:DNA-directed RNA polymerase subunit RPC12/RpoP
VFRDPLKRRGQFVTLFEKRNSRSPAADLDQGIDPARGVRTALPAGPAARTGQNRMSPGSGARADRSGEVKAPSLTERQLEGLITELERLGYSHVRISCTDCGHNALMSFFLMRTRGTITEATTFLELADQIRCPKCRHKLPADKVHPVHQSELPGSAGPRRERRDSL